MHLTERNNEEAEDEEFKESYGTIFEDIEYTGSTWCKYYYPLFLFRRFVYAILLVSLNDYPIVQLALSLFVVILPVRYYS